MVPERSWPQPAPRTSQASAQAPHSSRSGSRERRSWPWRTLPSPGAVAARWCSGSPWSWEDRGNGHTPDAPSATDGSGRPLLGLPGAPLGKSIGHSAGKSGWHKNTIATGWLPTASSPWTPAWTSSNGDAHRPSPASPAAARPGQGERGARVPFPPTGPGPGASGAGHSTSSPIDSLKLPLQGQGQPPPALATTAMATFTSPACEPVITSHTNAPALARATASDQIDRCGQRINGPSTPTAPLTTGIVLTARDPQRRLRFAQTASLYVPRKSSAGLTPRRSAR